VLQELTWRQVHLLHARIERRHDRERADAIENVARGAAWVLGDKGETAKLVRRLREGE